MSSPPALHLNGSRSTLILSHTEVKSPPIIKYHAMSAEASIPPPPLPGKDPPSQTSPNPTSPASISPSLLPPPNLPLSASRTRPYISTTSISSIPLQGSELPPPRPNFNPFFTLINDSSTQSTHHPSRIHYIFSDDDESEVLTAACVRSLHNQIEEDVEAMGGSGEGVRESGTSSSSSATFKKGSNRKDEAVKVKAAVKREERVIIVDINDTGDGIVSSSSLSASWQVVHTEIANAPTLNNDSTAETDGGDGERGLMLRIEGMGIGASGEEMGDSGMKGKGKGVGESGVMGEEEMQALLEGFDRKMAVLRKIVAAGEGWDEARREKGAGEGDQVEEV